MTVSTLTLPCRPKPLNYLPPKKWLLKATQRLENLYQLYHRALSLRRCEHAEALGTVTDRFSYDPADWGKWTDIFGGGDQSVSRLLELATTYFKVSLNQLRAKDRTYPLTDVRQYLFVILHRSLGFTLAEAGAVLGRHHSTVIRALKQFDHLSAGSKSYRTEWQGFLAHLDRFHFLSI